MTVNINKVAATAVAIAMLASPATAGDINVNWKMAGTLMTGVEFVDPATGGTRTAGLLHMNAVGSPGAAEIRALGQTKGPPMFGACLDGAGLVLEMDFNDIVATFKDMSQLFASLDTGSICIDLATGEVDSEIDLEITGGTGRFEGATGVLLLTGISSPIGGPLNSAFTEVKGTIHTP